MTFFTISLIAGGLVAAVIPVVLHLVMQGHPKTYEFPALRFIRLRLAANQRRFRLKHLLLLALRVLLLVLLGIALARPTLRYIGGHGVVALPFWSQEGNIATRNRQPVAAVIVIDTSPRMSYVAANKTRLAEAQEHALWLLEQFPKDSRVAVLGSQRVPASFHVDLLAARERIDRLSTVMTGRSLLESLAEGARLLKQTTLECHEIYLITDMTEPGWPDAMHPSVRAALENIPDATLHLIDVGMDAVADTALTRVTISDEVLSSEMPLRIEVELSHIGEAESRTVELYIGARDEGRGARGEESEIPIPFPGEKRDTKTVDFPAGTSRRNVVFELSVLSEGTNQGVIRLTSPDALAANDEIGFTVEVRPPSRVLIVTPQEEQRQMQTLFLREALAPEQLRLNGIIPYRIDTMTVDQFNESPPRPLTDYRAVFLLDPPPLPPTSWKKLADHAAAGNGVAVFLGRNATPISEFNEGTARELLGVTLRMQVPSPDGDLWLTGPGYENPVLRPFREMDVVEIPWHAVPIFRYWHIDNLAAGTDIVMQYSDGRPAIVTRTMGQGRVLVATTPVSDLPDEKAWNLLPTSIEAPWLFVMLSDGITQFLLGVGERNYNYLAGQLVTLRPDVPQLPASCIVKPPQGEGIRVTTDSIRQAITFPATEQLGNYTVSSGGTGGVSRLQTGFSVIAPAQTWNLTRITPEQAQAVCGNRLRITNDRSTLEVGVSQSRTGRELFPLVMLLVLTVFVAEYFVSNRFYGEESS